MKKVADSTLRQNLIVYLLVAILAVLLMPSIGWAAPFLVSNPNPVGDGVLNAVYVETITSTQCTAADVQGKPRVSMPDVANAIRYDMIGVSNGQHNWCVAQVNIWGESSFVPFSFTKNAPAVPTGLVISP